MAHSKPVVLPAMHIETEIQCRVCMEQKRLQILGCGHKFCQACISKYELDNLTSTQLLRSPIILTFNR